MKQTGRRSKPKNDYGFGAISLIFAFVVIIVLTIVGAIVLKRVRLDHQTPPTPINNAQVRAQLTSTQQASRQLIDKIAASSLTSIGVATYATCTQGHTPIIMIAGGGTDPYKFLCNARETAIYGFNGNFHDTLLQLDASLTDQGWQAEKNASLAWVASNYATKTAGYDDSLAAHPRGLNASGVPASTEGYTKDGFKISVNYGAINGGFDTVFDAETNTPNTVYYSSEDLFSEAQLNEASKNFRYVIGVSLDRDFYRVDP